MTDVLFSTDRNNNLISAQRTLGVPGSFAGVPFRVNPISIGFEYNCKTSETETIGGRVVQVFGTTLGDLTVSGVFGIGGWQEQRVFLERLKIIAAQQGVQPMGVQPSDPVRFTLPSHGYDFLVRLKAFSQTQAQASVMWDNRVISPGWDLVLFIEQDNVGLKGVAPDAFIQRLAAGIGWAPSSDYNGPQTPDPTAVAQLGAEAGQTLGVGGQPVASSGTGGSGVPVPAAGQLGPGTNEQKAFNFFVSSGLTNIQAAAIVGNLMAESSMNPEIFQGGGGPGRGIAQWSVGERWKPSLMTGNVDADLAAQLAYVWEELTGPYSSALAALKSATTVYDAVYAIEKHYEVDAYTENSSSPNPIRVNLAQQALTQYGGG